ncbi:MAG: hypothetical protein E7584_00945 [Ruminococcaceae bacterium]|nr:hypothetical protein [Oscillospiraceae bacterium]
MKRYIKELIIFVLQLCMFYILPLFAGPADAIGMVLLIVLATLLLSLVIGVASDSKVKYLYPVVIAVTFIPSVFIYYNESALIHSVWYLIVSVVGLAIGSLINLLSHKTKLSK